MVEQTTLGSAQQASTTFCVGDGALWLGRLCGLTCGHGGEDRGPARARGLAVLRTTTARFEAEDLQLIEHSFGADSAHLVCSVPDGSIRWESQWTLDGETGVWSRKDSMRNLGQEPVTLTRCLARFPFTPGHYEVYSQRSSWCDENQGSWQALDHGTLVLGCRGGRTTEGGTPYLCLRERGSTRGVVFHVLPRGNWTIRVSRQIAGGRSLPFAVVELGLSDESLRLGLPAGGTFALPEILVQGLPQGRPELGAPQLHQYAHKSILGPARRSAPVMYNTWFDVFEHLEVGRLRKQLAAAKELGCEVFAIDAGWYGAGEGNWSLQVGDWREKQDAAFRGDMASFADEVRATGLGFGLWMEPERNFASVPAVQAHPDWFLPGDKGCYRPDLAQEQAYQYILFEMSRLVETYELAWMKVDFNFELGEDAAELAYYYQRWYALLDELRARYPDTFFEGCASGGMRSDLHTLSHFDGHFPSDTVDPVDVLRICQGALLRLPPGRLTSWVVLRSVGHTIVPYGYPTAEAPETLVAPGNATWTESNAFSSDFAARVALPGILGFSGDVASLSQDARRRLRHHVAFYKEWRTVIGRSVAHLLTPPCIKTDRTGWAAIQLRDPETGSSLLFVYRLDDGVARRWFPLRDLDPAQVYQVSDDDVPDGPHQERSGRELMDEGISVELSERYDAAVFVVSATGNR